MSTRKELEVLDPKTENVIANTLTGLVQGLTGVATSSKTDLILSISHTFQRMRGGQFLSVLLDEWNRFKGKGKVKEDYQHTEQHKVCLQELLEFLDKDSPDEIRFKALKQIFLVAASEEITDRNSMLPQQFMKIARSLSSGEVILLKSIYRVVKEEPIDSKQHLGVQGWISKMTSVSGLKYSGLVEIYEQDLMDKKLVTPRTHGDKSGVSISPYFRLSDLGYELCNFIEAYKINKA
jgi:hypothetical protein